MTQPRKNKQWPREKNKTRPVPPLPRKGEYAKTQKLKQLTPYLSWQKNLGHWRFSLLFVQRLGLDVLNVIVQEMFGTVQDMNPLACIDRYKIAVCLVTFEKLSTWIWTHNWHKLGSFTLKQRHKTTHTGTNHPTETNSKGLPKQWNPWSGISPVGAPSIVFHSSAAEWMKTAHRVVCTLRWFRNQVSRERAKVHHFDFRKNSHLAATCRHVPSWKKMIL